MRAGKAADTPILTSVELYLHGVTDVHIFAFQKKSWQLFTLRYMVPPDW